MKMTAAALVMSALLSAPLDGQSLSRIEADCWANPVCQQASHAAMHATAAWAVDKALGGLVDDTGAALISSALAAFMEMQDISEHGFDGGDDFGSFDPLVDVTFRIGGSVSVRWLP